MSHHVMGKCGVNCPPVAGDIQKNKKAKKYRKKDSDRSTLALIDVKHLVQCITPQFNYAFHNVGLVTG